MGRSRLVLVFLLCVFWQEAFAQDFDRIKVETVPLRGDLYLLQSRAGGNLAACVGKDGVFLVDSEYAALFDKVKAALAGISEKPVQFVFNTHWHFDHVGGNERFAEGGSRIIAHENVRKSMAVNRHIAVIDVDIPASPEGALPMITFTDALTYYFGDEEITLFHPPGAHTDGDGVVRFKKANVVHTGDIVFNRGYPFIDVNNGGSIDGMIAAIDAILEICDDETLIIPGHGPLSNKAELRAYGTMLKDFRDAVAGEMATGKDLAAIQQAKPTADLDARWGRFQFPPDKFTEIVHLSLSRKKQ